MYIYIHARSHMVFMCLSYVWNVIHRILFNLSQMNRTPLHYAAALSDEVADLLKSSGADTNAKDAVSSNCS